MAGAEEVTAVGEAEAAEEEAVRTEEITVIHIEMIIEVEIMVVIIEGTTTPTETAATQEVTEIVVVAATAIKVAAAIITRTPTSRTKVTVNNSKVKDTISKVKEVKEVKEVKDILNRRRHNNPMASSNRAIHNSQPPPRNRMHNHNSKRMHNQPQTNTILLLRHTLHHQDKARPPHKLTNNKLINNQPLKLTNSKVMPLNLPHQLVNINNLQQDSRDGSDRLK